MTATARPGAGTPGGAATLGEFEVDARDISWWAEDAHGRQGRPLKLIVRKGATKPELEEEDQVPADATVLCAVNTPTFQMERPEEVILKVKGKARELLQNEPLADALFWTVSAIEKFVLPYYMSQRLLTDDQFTALVDSYRSGKLTAILHMAPSKPVAREAFTAAFVDEQEIRTLPLTTFVQEMAKAAGR